MRYPPNLPRGNRPVTIEDEVAPEVRRLLDRAGLAIVLREVVAYVRERSPRTKVARALRAALADYEARYRG